MPAQNAAGSIATWSSSRSIDKRAHAGDAEPTIWDTIEFDRAGQVALDFARRTNGDSDPTNDPLIVATAHHECGSGDRRRRKRGAPAAPLGLAVRDHAVVFRFDRALALNFFPSDPVAARLPHRSGSITRAAARVGDGADRDENWLANRTMLEAAGVEKDAAGRTVAVANPERDARDGISGSHR